MTSFTCQNLLANLRFLHALRGGCLATELTSELSALSSNFSPSIWPWKVINAYYLTFWKNINLIHLSILRVNVFLHFSVSVLLVVLLPRFSLGAPVSKREVSKRTLVKDALLSMRNVCISKPNLMILTSKTKKAYVSVKKSI